jgi:aryl-alcohol dehydrogenase-like predicted oxidoreductase
MKKIREECEQSLRRLAIETIDLYQIHWPVPDDEIEAGWYTMAELQREGKVRYIGVSNFSAAQMDRALKIAPITSLQPPYSMINRNVEPQILPYCAKHEIGIINYSPMQSGLLTGAMTADRIAKMPQDDFRRNTKQFQEPQLSRNLDLVELLRTIGKPHNVEPGVVAIAWTLHQPAITAAIVGGRSAKQVEGVLPAATFRLTLAEYNEIGKFLPERP